MDAQTREEAWWNRYSELEDLVWHYDPYLTQVVRGQYFREMFDYLYQPDGCLLDVGCGTGWISWPFARRGMAVHGFDLSEEQVTLARRNAAEAGIVNAHYTVATADSLEAERPYNAILIHALLHHLDDNEHARLLARLTELAAPGCRVYIFEPMAATPNPPLGAWLFDKLMGAVWRIMKLAGARLWMFRPEVALAWREGWTMRSPEEAPRQLGDLLGRLPRSWQVEQVRYWSAYGVMYANWCMMLRPWLRLVLRPLAPLFYAIDRAVLPGPYREYLRSWPMAAICVRIEK